MDDETGLEKDLAESTIRKQEYLIRKNFQSCGIRELDEMLGGGFLPGTFTLFQQDLGAGGEIIFSKIIELQLAFSNLVLVILSDPTASFLKEDLNEKSKKYPDTLMILDLVSEGKGNMNIFFDKHEISLRIREARRRAYDKLIEMRKTEEDENIQLFVITVSLNPFLLNLSRESVIRLLYDNLLQCIQNKSIDLKLLTKNIISTETNAQIQSIAHGVIDLSSYFEGTQKKFEIKILKMIGHNYDLKVEPYIIHFNEKLQKFSFNIKSAFLTSFETFRNLMTWNKGSISLAKQQYLIIPISYFNNLLEMPLNIDPKKGKDEIIEKGQGIGRRLGILVEKLYYLTDIDLFNATLQTASLLGWGSAFIQAYEPTENLITVLHKIHKEFRQKAYMIFLEGYYRGLIKRTLNRDVRYIKITLNNRSSDEIENKDTQINNYIIHI
ncbi:MAG: RAD55 family ATPase, partial [Promethearchaeota archaeon]